MRWLLHDGPREFVLSTEGGAPFAGATMIHDSNTAATILRDLAHDPRNLRTLRNIHTELLDSHNARSRADILVIAELMAQMAARRLYLFHQARQLISTYEAIPEDDEDDLLDDAESLVAEPAPPPPAPAPAPSPAVLAQAAALKKAAAAGAPFCEE